MDVKDLARMGGLAKWANIHSKRSEIMKRVQSGDKADNQRRR